MARERIGFGLTFAGIFLVVFAGLASASLASTVGNEAETILTSMRKAARSSALKQQTGDLLIRGRSNESGSSTEFSLRFTSGDRFLEKVEGPLGETRGCNDSCCWKFDRSGVSRTLELSDRDGCELLTRIQTGQWLANVDVKNVVVAPNEGDPRTAVLHLRQGRLKARLYVNRADLAAREPGLERYRGRARLDFSHVPRRPGLEGAGDDCRDDGRETGRDL